MDSGKVFVGGIGSDTTEEKLKEYFQSKYGEVKEVVISKTRNTNRSTGFGFLVFVNPSIIDSVVRDQHSIDDKTVDVRRAISREIQPPNPIIIQNNVIKKIFVGGLPNGIKEDEFRGYFQTYGNVTDFVIIYNRVSNRPRGFGFITFDSVDAVGRVLQKSFHSLNNKMVQVKLAIPKEVSHPQGYAATTATTTTYIQTPSSTNYQLPVYGDYHYQYHTFMNGQYPLPLVPSSYGYFNGQYPPPLSQVPCSYGYVNGQYPPPPPPSQVYEYPPPLQVPCSYGYVNNQYNPFVPTVSNSLNTLYYYNVT